MQQLRLMEKCILLFQVSNITALTNGYSMWMIEFTFIRPFRPKTIYAVKISSQMMMQWLQVSVIKMSPSESVVTLHGSLNCTEPAPPIVNVLVQWPSSVKMYIHWSWCLQSATINSLYVSTAISNHWHRCHSPTTVQNLPLILKCWNANLLGDQQHTLCHCVLWFLLDIVVYLYSFLCPQTEVNSYRGYQISALCDYDCPLHINHRYHQTQYYNGIQSVYLCYLAVGYQIS